MPRRSVARTGGAETPEFEISKYNRVVEIADLSDIRLVASRFSVSPEYFTGQDDHFELELQDKLEWVRFNETDTVAVGSIYWELRCSGGENEALKVTSTYMIIYEFSEKIERRYMRTFVENVGRFAVYPFFRALVAHYSSAAAANIPLLPVLKQTIPSPPSEGEEKPDVDAEMQRPKRKRSVPRARQTR